MKIAAALAFLGGIAHAQQVGTSTPEVHPPLPSPPKRARLQEANVGGSKNCYTGNTWDTSLCPDPATCAANCALDGADYTGTYGISASGESVSMKLVTKGPYSTNVGSRVYLLEDDNNYKLFKLLNQEFTFDVDASQLPCGLNGALYFVQMDKDGGKSKFSTNKAGAAYGTGYCDAQCPHDIKFICGEANVKNWVPSKGDPNGGTGQYGSCCAEMDIWESNSFGQAYTSHPCTRFYVQNGKAIDNTAINWSGIDPIDSLTDKVCDQAKVVFGDPNDHSKKGGLKAMGDALKKGVVLTMSLWVDYAANCLWLDSTYPTTKDASVPGAGRGTCAKTSGVPADVLAQSPGATVKYGNIRVGDLGSTTAAVKPPSPSTSTPSVSTPVPSSAPATPVPSSATPTDAPSNSPTDAPSDSPTDAPSNSPTDAPATPPLMLPATRPLMPPVTLQLTPQVTHPLMPLRLLQARTLLLLHLPRPPRAELSQCTINVAATTTTAQLNVPRDLNAICGVNGTPNASLLPPALRRMDSRLMSNAVAKATLDRRNVKMNWNATSGTIGTLNVFTQATTLPLLHRRAPLLQTAQPMLLRTAQRMLLRTAQRMLLRTAQPPTDAPSDSPTDAPSDSPTDAHSDSPTDAPSDSPTDAPSDSPTDAPSDSPTDAPLDSPTENPEPTTAPVDPTSAPSETPQSTKRTRKPSPSTPSPSQSTTAPSDAPSDAPTTAPTTAPTDVPTDAPSSSPSTPPADGSLAFEAKLDGIYLNGSPFLFKGANYFGLESDISVPHGLWGGGQSTAIAKIAALLKSNGFNSVRLPFAVDAALSNKAIDPSKIVNEVALLKQFSGKTLSYFDVMDYTIKTFADNKIVVLLDAHVLTGYSGITDLWYSSSADKDNFENAWKIVANRYKNTWNVIAADLKNEPENLMDVQRAPITLPVANRLVQPYFSASNYPDNMPNVWDLHFGFVNKKYGPLVVGEWGGKYLSTNDIKWQNKFSSYLKTNNIGSFYWSLNPNSGDTQGVLQDDWNTPRSTS
ncbi:hypothetical protein LEN26_017032 [Aphanomyces euteiches]|nr:hypothetical protein LEN26_017032 [Aphanomyces euteiches]